MYNKYFYVQKGKSCQMKSDEEIKDYKSYTDFFFFKKQKTWNWTIKQGTHNKVKFELNVMREPQILLQRDAFDCDKLSGCA